MQNIRFNIGFIDWLHSTVKKQPNEKIASIVKDAIPKNITAPIPPTCLPTPEISPQVEIQLSELLLGAPEIISSVFDATIEILPEALHSNSSPYQAPSPSLEEPSLNQWLGETPLSAMDVIIPLSDRHVTIIDSTSNSVSVSLAQRIFAKMTLSNVTCILLIAAAVACVFYLAHKWKDSENPIEKPHSPKEVEKIVLSLPAEVQISSEKDQDESTVSKDMNEKIYFAATLISTMFMSLFFRKNLVPSPAQESDSEQRKSSVASFTKSRHNSPDPINPEGSSLQQGSHSQTQLVLPNCANTGSSSEVSSRNGNPSTIASPTRCSSQDRKSPKEPQSLLGNGVHNSNHLLDSILQNDRKTIVQFSGVGEEFGFANCHSIDHNLPDQGCPQNYKTPLEVLFDQLINSSFSSLSPIRTDASTQSSNNNSISREKSIGSTALRQNIYPLIK